jgi:myo-inositol-1(or 4)-monophosphatase
LGINKKLDYKSDEFLNVAVEAAIAASHIIMEALGKPRVAQFKGKTDLVTETDLLSEKVIKSIIRASFPDHDILAEESKKESSQSDFLWIIDPLDGTSNFVHGYPSFAVSI